MLKVPLVLVFLFLAPAASAATQVVYECHGDNAVGFRKSSLRWGQATFNDSPAIRIVQSGLAEGDWVVEVEYDQWEYVASGKHDDDLWFAPQASLAGQDFIMNMKSLRFAFVDSLAYLNDNPDGTAHLTVGTCVRLPK